MEDQRLGVLESFGLGGYLAKAYLALLELGPSQAREVSERSGVPQGRVYDVLEKLHQRGLAEVLPEAPRRYRSVPFEVFLDREMHNYNERISTLERERESLIATMTPARLAEAPAERGEYTVIRGRKALLERSAGVIDGAAHDVLIIGTERTPLRLRSEPERLRKAHERGAKLRLLVPVTKDNAAAVHELSQAGVEVRHHGALGETFPPGLSVLLVEGERALLHEYVPDDLNEFRGEDVGLIMEHPQMVRGIRALVQMLWALALPAAERLHEIATVPGAKVPGQTILIVDDEPDILLSLRELLLESVKDVAVETAESGMQGLEVLRRTPVDLIITDFKLPGMTGLEFLEEARKLAPGVQRILMTAYPDLRVAASAINEARVENFFMKPIEDQRMIEIVRVVLEERRANALRNRALARSMELLQSNLASVQHEIPVPRSGGGKAV